MKVTYAIPSLNLSLDDIQLTSHEQYYKVTAQLTNVQNRENTLKCINGSLTTSTSELNLNDPDIQQHEEWLAAVHIRSFFPSLGTSQQPPTCGEVADALRKEYESALATASQIVDQGPTGLRHRSDSEWPKYLRGTVTCHIAYTLPPVRDIESYFECSSDKAKLVRSSLTIKDFFLAADTEDRFFLGLSHITIKNIQFDSYQPGSIKFPHSQITGGVFNTPYATVDLTNATLEKMSFGNPRTARRSSISCPPLTLTGATCTNVNFAGINSRLYADDSRFLDVNISDAIINLSDFSNAHLKSVSFDHTQAKGTHFGNANLENVIWRYSNFSDVYLKNTRITLDLSDEPLRNDDGFGGAIFTIYTLPKHYKTLREELARSVKQRLTELAVDQPRFRSMVVRLERLFGV